MRDAAPTDRRPQPGRPVLGSRRPREEPLRPAEPWAGGIGYSLPIAAESLHVARETEGAGAWLCRWGPNLGILAAYGWASAEPLRFAAQMRRRMRLGFGDALVANRMQLWGAGTAAIAGVALLHLVAQLRGHYELPASLIGVASSLVLVTAVTEWLAFFPPRAWLRRFASKQA